MPLKVFLVEDSHTIRDSLIPTLQELVGAEVVKAVEGESDARRWLAANRDWSLAAVDLFLKDGSGLGVLAATQTRKHRQAVVILTNYATADVRSRCMRLGANGVFDKSTQLEEFFDYCRGHGAGS